MKIIVITDVHANLPALEAALQSIQAEGYDALFHTGDAIAIGPYPAECVEVLLNTRNAQFVVGNHEAYFINGLPTPQPAWMSDGEVQHQRWTHARLGPHLRAAIAKWPYVLTYDFEGVKTTFVHYGLEPSGQDFRPIIKNATAAELNNVFASHDAALIFHGHNHRKSDVKGQTRYVNPGSLGCYHQAIARYCVVEFHHGQYQVEQRSVPYNDANLFDAFEQRNVPERKFICRTFFSRRSQTVIRHKPV